MRLGNGLVGDKQLMAGEATRAGPMWTVVALLSLVLPLPNESSFARQVSRRGAVSPVGGCGTGEEKGRDLLVEDCLRCVATDEHACEADPALDANASNKGSNASGSHIHCRTERAMPKVAEVDVEWDAARLTVDPHA